MVKILCDRQRPNIIQHGVSFPVARCRHAELTRAPDPGSFLAPFHTQKAHSVIRRLRPIAIPKGGSDFDKRARHNLCAEHLDQFTVDSDEFLPRSIGKLLRHILAKRSPWIHRRDDHGFAIESLAQIGRARIMSNLSLDPKYQSTRTPKTFSP